MAKVTSFGFTNGSEAASKSVPLFDLGYSNYALVADEPTECRLVNKTAAIDREENISFRCKDIARVNTTLDIQNPPKIQGGVQYQIQAEAVLTTEDPDTGFIVNEPIVVQLSVRHPKSGNITDAMVQTMISRTVSACLNTNGTWRVSELMRSALKPTRDF
jgi:hypothetical protein